MKANAVFSGGGVKGIAFVGAVQVCEERGYTWNRLAGTSSGSIIAALLAAGYTAKEIKGLLNTLDYRRVVASLWNHIPLSYLIRLFIKKGLYTGSYLEDWIDQQLAKKGVRTFSDLPEGKLSIIASDLTTGQIVNLPEDSHLFQLDPHQLKVSKAIRMSISIPLFFTPIVLRSRHRHYIVDGGVISNFPVWLFDDDKIPPAIPTFGFCLRSAHTQQVKKIFGPISMLYAVISVMLENQDMKYIEKQDAVRTIFIPTEGVSATNFHITRKEQENLYQSGINAAQEFFTTWNFEHYIKYFHKRRSERKVI